MPTDADDIDVTELDLGWNLGILFRAYLRQANAAFADVPGGPRGYQLLTTVERTAPASQLVIAGRLGIDRTATTHLIDTMVEAGLVERTTDPADRRARVVVATVRGRRLLPRLDRRLGAIESELLGGLTTGDAQHLQRLLRAAAAPLDPLNDPRDIARQMSPQRARKTST